MERNVKLPDTSWHIGYVIKDEDDPRRHKSRCVYNNGEKCSNAHMLECVSSSHCKYYAETWEEADRYNKSMVIKNDLPGIMVSALKVANQDKKKNKTLLQTKLDMLSINYSNKDGYQDLLSVNFDVDTYIRKLHSDHTKLTLNERKILIYEIYKSTNSKLSLDKFMNKYKAYINNKPITHDNCDEFNKIYKYINTKYMKKESQKIKKGKKKIDKRNKGKSKCEKKDITTRKDNTYTYTLGAIIKYGPK